MLKEKTSRLPRSPGYQGMPSSSARDGVSPEMQVRDRVWSLSQTGRTVRVGGLGQGRDGPVGDVGFLSSLSVRS